MDTNPPSPATSAVEARTPKPEELADELVLPKGSQDEVAEAAEVVEAPVSGAGTTGAETPVPGAGPSTSAPKRIYSRKPKAQVRPASVVVC